ncbi:hypothetical protein ADUPG1_002174 [Aduncisulcus paluster]|uniref:Uncharacterized protein n=1 Tax=Aduncisulcus paluster TaxID=2918883 RepID=A0ABQ5KHN2_9EUKA|nr:hypothetical protein ADUPG1_002174 [Aduncisulcus paluster]
MFLHECVVCEEAVHRVVIVISTPVTKILKSDVMIGFWQPTVSVRREPDVIVSSPARSQVIIVILCKATHRDGYYRSSTDLQPKVVAASGRAGRSFVPIEYFPQT